MKNINFQRSNSAIRVWEEDQKSRIPFNWDRLVYIFILVLILFFAIRYAFNKLFYIEAFGEVMLENVNIMNTDDCRVLKYYVKAGDKVKKGDTLFSYYDDPDFELGGAFRDAVSGGNGNRVSVDLNSQSQKPEWIEREIYNLNRTIKGNEIRLAENRKLLQLYKNRLQTTKNEVVLDLAPRGNFTEMEKRIEEMQYEADRLQNEIAMAKEFLGRLYAMINDFNPDNQDLKINTVDQNPDVNGMGGGSDDEYVKYFRAPIEGTVTKINFEEYEVAVKSEVILTIHKLENIYIQAYFDQEDVSDIKEGDEVFLEFPDGTSSEGIIKGYYFTTNRIPEEFQKKYEPTTRSLTVEIYPKDSTEMKKWKKYHKLHVTITKYRW
jgi:hypothetical protein